MAQHSGQSGLKTTATKRGTPAARPVSGLRETPWGNVVHRTSGSAIATATSKMSAQTNGGTAHEKSCPGTETKADGPASKPNCAGPKPVLPGSKPALPGPKPALPGPKPALPTGPKPVLSISKREPLSRIKPPTAPVAPPTKVAVNGPKPAPPPSAVTSSGQPSNSNRKPLLPPGATDRANKMAAAASKEVVSPRTIELDSSPKFPHRPSSAQKGQSPTQKGLSPTQKGLSPAQKGLQSPRKPTATNSQPSFGPPLQPRVSTSFPRLQHLSSNPPPSLPSNKPTGSTKTSSAVSIVARLFEERADPGPQLRNRPAPYSRAAVPAEDLEKSQSLPTNLDRLSRRNRSNAMERLQGEGLRTSFCSRSTSFRSRSSSADLHDSSSHDSAGEEVVEEEEVEVQRRSLTYESSNDSFEIIPSEQGQGEGLVSDVDRPLPSLEIKMQDLPAPPPATPPPDTPPKAALTPEQLAEKNRAKRKHIALELLSTEEKYVQKLRLIAVDFHAAVVSVNKNKVVVPDHTLNQIFLNIKPIYQLNSELLSSLQEMVQQWDEKEELGGRLSRLAPFLKLYANYTSRFEVAMETLTEWSKKEKKFDAALKDFERSPECGHLGVAHHMLEPVQRIPRYRLLLLDYLKHLPDDHPDREPSMKAMVIISEAADKANDRIKELENLNEIQAIQRSLQDYEETLLCPGRTFVKKGRLYKFSRKTTHMKMFFLFSDILIHANMASSGGYKCRNVMPVRGMKVEQPQVSPEPHTFVVVSTTRSLTLAAGTEDEKVDWVATLLNTISELKNKTMSFKITEEQFAVSIDTEGFGVKAPVWVPDDNVSMCQLCCAHFTFTNRRHHCRACGKVICSSCFKYKVFLLYKGKDDKICNQCYEVAKAQGVVKGTDTPAPVVETTEHQHKTALDVSAYGEDAAMAGYGLLAEGRQKWTRYWLQLKKDCVLYRFKAHEDVRAIESVPLPGFNIKQERDNVVLLIHPHNSYKLKFEDEEVEKWVDMLHKAAALSIS